MGHLREHPATRTRTGTDIFPTCLHTQKCGHSQCRQQYLALPSSISDDRSSENERAPSSERFYLFAKSPELPKRLMGHDTSAP